MGKSKDEKEIAGKSMDRFDSTEDFIFHEEAMSQGRLARMDGFPENSNPYLSSPDQLPTSWLSRSWLAGWSDADMDDQAPKKDIF